jgi:Zn-dependent M28 family amino/carboxypeptidase
VSIVRLIDENKIKADVAHLSAYRNRAAGSEENRQAVNWTEDRLKGLGYQTQQICYRAGLCSVIADRQASTESTKVLLVLAHIDSVGRAFAGADDNASGTAVLLEMARVLASTNLRKNLRFFVTNGEENGLLGAKHYVRELEKAGTLNQISLALNMDMVGFNEENGIVELETNRPYEALALKFADHAHTYTKLKTKITLSAWGSDHVPFLEKRVPALLTIENWETKTPCYHAACDTPDTLNYPYATEIGRMNVAAIMEEGLRP